MTVTLELDDEHAAALMVALEKLTIVRAGDEPHVRYAVSDADHPLIRDVAHDLDVAMGGLFSFGDSKPRAS